MGKLLGSEEYVSRLALRNEGLVKKLYGYFTTAHDKATSKEVRRALKKICDTFGKAIDNSVGGVKLSSIREKEKEELLAAKEEYLSLPESERAAWLEENGYTAEDFNDDVLEYSDETKNTVTSINQENMQVTGDEIIDLSNNSELSQKINGLRGAQKYKAIQNFILNILGNRTVKLTDGKKAIVDNRDALHIANKSGTEKASQIAQIKRIVETAELYAEDTNVEHNKFDYFCYYRAVVRYGKETFPIYLNVGRAINDGKYHIYDITKKIKDTANRINGLERPKPNEGYALENDVSIDSISENGEKSNSFSKKTLENSSERANNGENSNMRSSYSKVDAKITPGMSDAERYEVLKNKHISVSAIFDQSKLESVIKKLDISDSEFDLSKYGDKKRLFKKLGDEFGVFKEYNNSDIKISFSFSKGGIAESIGKQRKGYMRFARMLTCFDDIVESAVGIEIHNRNSIGYKEDPTLKNVYVLAGAFSDGDDIVPVKLEVKEFRDKENTLYVAIALESIKKNEIVKQEVAKNGVAQQYSPSFTVSISEYFKKINPSDESFYKYIPKPFLSEEKNNENDNMRFSQIKVPTVASVQKTKVDNAGEKGYTYSEEQYNKFGWARGNDILNAGQNRDYRSKFAEAVNGSDDFCITSQGEYMIPVSDIYDEDAEGINNTIVYAKGTVDDPIITRVLTIDAYDETTLSEIRSNLYAFERKGIRQEAGGIFEVHTRADVKDYVDYKGSGTQITRYNDRFGAERGAGRGASSEAFGRSKKTERINKYRSGYHLHVEDDGETTETNGNMRFSKIKVPTAAYVHKHYAEWQKLKVYEKKDAEKMVDTVLMNVISDNEIFAEMSGASRKQAQRLLQDRLNSAVTKGDNVDYFGRSNNNQITKKNKPKPKGIREYSIKSKGISPLYS